MKKLEIKLIHVLGVIGVVVFVIGSVYVAVWYHLYAPCSWHHRLDTVQNLPARCLQR
jgi:Ni,Fe-hydrogenase I cytochrome b subunit